MTVSSELSSEAWAAELPDTLRADLGTLEDGYFRHVETDDADCEITAPTLTFRAHLTLALTRQPGQGLVRVHHPDDGSGLGAAVQIVTDDMPMLVDSVTALFGRMGGTISEVIHPIFTVERDSGGTLTAARLHEADLRRNGTGDGRESWIHLQLHPATSARLLDEIAAAVPDVINDVRQVSSDTEAIHAIVDDLATRLEQAGDSAADADIEPADCARLLRWLADDNFTMLGYARYRLEPGAELPVPVADSELGVLHPGTATGFQVPITAGARPLLRMTQGLIPVTMQRAVYPYYIGVADLDSAGEVRGEHLFVGVFTVTALHENVLDIPVVGQRVRAAIKDSGFDLDSFSGQAMLEVMQGFPRTELFSSDAATLRRTATAVLNVGLRRQVRLFLRVDPYGRFVAAMVYLPRDRYTTAVRLEMQDILVRELGGASIDYSARVSESELASVYFTIRMPGADTTEPVGAAEEISEDERRRIQNLLAEASRTWDDHLNDAVNASTVLDPQIVRRYCEAFPEGYKQDFSARRALADIDRLERLRPGSIDQHLYRVAGAPAGSWRFTLYIGGSGISLSQVLPVLQSLGVEVLDERPYRIRRERDGHDAEERWIYDFGLLASHELLDGALDQDLDAELLEVAPDTLAAPKGKVAADRVRDRFTAAFDALWYGRAEADGLNELVLRAGLSWRAVAVLRTYAKYLQQAGFPYSQVNIARVLHTYPDAAKLFAQLFTARFDPDSHSTEQAAELEERLHERIDQVVSLDADRILRAILGLIRATLRTNYYVTDPDGAPRDFISVKVEPQEIAELPQPRPKYEIFVYSPRVEGVHLRFGAVARGGLRWSDRLEDFRTEILGLVKAQAVKNAVIVPVGAKGGFVVKRPPAATGDAATDRQARMAEGIECYRTFISGLLDITDNVDLAGGQVLPPERVVRRDGDDTYLVVAADKGTATFSDIANDVAGRYGFWLGDAFASGGSAGYDHKAMGITARGAWESVKRHFAEMGVDTQSQDFTVVGVGDMSGDVFGNGMLLSEHIRLVAAFDHRHIFLDPDPDAGSSFGERSRLFGLARSSWADYDRSLISAGGGVYDRTAKAIPVSPEVRAALKLPAGVTRLSPPEMIRAILEAPVDLLWNGGIGTYIKASSETNADVGDKSNDAVRVNADRLRVKVIGEGGNLGATPLGRIEFCRNGGKMNTDALDNSAGVDCSDHEVNIKVLLDGVVSAGELDIEDRNPLLAEMTDEVAELVLRDNISQNFRIGLSRSGAGRRGAVHRRLLTELETRRGVDRRLEALPADAEMERRIAGGAGLTSPELATMIAHVKLALKADLLAGDLPDSPTFAAVLPDYFPTPLRERFAGAITRHPLRREIVATVVVNEMVDFGGATFAFRLSEEIGATTDDAVRAFTAAVEIFGLRELWQRIRSEQMPTSVRDQLELETNRTLERAARWLLLNRPQPIAIGADITRYREGVRALADRVPGWLPKPLAERVAAHAAEATEHGAPQDLAAEVYRLIHLFPLLDVLDIADIAERDAREIAELYFALNAHLEITRLISAVGDLDHDQRWASLARLALRDDLYESLRLLTLDIATATDPEDPVTEKLDYWEQTNRSRLTRARAALTEIFGVSRHDLATLSVAARQVRSLAGSSESGIVA
jgi:glutamate dehydrogenase